MPNIVSQEEKAAFLRRSGWETLWSEDNWIKTEWKGQFGDIDRAGSSTDRAYEQAANRPCVEPSGR